MLLPTIIAALVLLAPIAYVAWRKLSVVEHEITFAEPQRGVKGVTLVIQEDTVQRLRIAFDDGQVYEVFPAALEASGHARTAAGCRPSPTSRDASSAPPHPGSAAGEFLSGSSMRGACWS